MLSIMIASIIAMGPQMKGAIRTRMMDMTVNMLINNTTLQKKINLSDAQLDKIRKVHYDTEKKVISLSKDIGLLDVDIKQLLDQKDPDLKLVENKVRKASSIEASLKMAKITEWVTIKHILTDSQIEGIKEFAATRVRRFMKGMRGRHGGEEPAPRR